MNFDLSNQLEQMVGAFLQAIPAIVGALLVLFIGYLVAKGIATAVHKVMQKMNVDRKVTSGPGGNYIQQVSSSPSRVVSSLTFWVLMLGVISLAVSVLGIPALTAFLGAIYSYIPNVIAAVAIFLVAGAVAGAVGGFAKKTMGDTPTGKMLATIIPGIVMTIAVFMILNQLLIAPEIVTITFAALMFALALTTSLAFGLGGRNVASQMLEQAYTKGQGSLGQVKSDFQKGRQNAAQMANQAKEKTSTDEAGAESASRGFSPQPTFGERIEPDQNYREDQL